MKLGEFRKATEHLPDDCELKVTESNYDVTFAYDVQSVCVKTDGASEETPESKTSVIII